MKRMCRLTQLIASILLPLVCVGGLYSYAVEQQLDTEPVVIVPAGGNCRSGQSAKSSLGMPMPWPHYLYDETYGWFDTTHFHTGDPARVISDVQAAIMAGGGMITISQGVREDITGYTGYYWVSGSIAEPDMLHVALGIYLDWSWRFESWQGRPPRSIAGPFTPFAIEDLPSQYVGFFAAARQLSYAQVFGCYLGGVETAVSDPPHLDFCDDPADTNDLPEIMRLENDTFMPLVQTDQGWQNRSWPDEMQMKPVASRPWTWYFLGEETWYFDDAR